MCVSRQDPTTPEVSVTTVEEWLDAIKMGQYKESFSSAGYVTLDSVLYISARSDTRPGLDLMGLSWGHDYERLSIRFVFAMC